MVAVFLGGCSLPPVSLLPCPLFPSHPPPCAFFSAPMIFGYLTVFPPSPRPRSQSALPGGKGETLGYFMQGASPLASPGLKPGRRWFDRRRRCPAYEPGRRWLRAGNRASGGGLGRFTRRVYFWCIIKILPLSPRPALAERSSPPGKGETFSFLMQGASPLASPGRSRGGAGSTGAGGAHAYEPGRHWLRAGNRASGGGLGGFTRRV